jgi:tRNA/rRNA methyltransferase
MTDRVNLDNLAVVLHRPRIPENIGATARAMCNMGIKQLIVVDPRNCDLTRVCKTATHGALDVVENMEQGTSLKTALGPFNYVVGTTARLGGQRRRVRRPGQLAREIASVSAENRVALLFGPEDRGLTNEDIRLCHGLVNIPTASFSSLNLAQAVMILCYEMFRYSGEPRKEVTPHLANRFELEAMYDGLRDVLIRISFINPDNPDYFMNNLRHLFSRLQLRARDVRIVRGIIRQINWYGNKRYEDGLRDRGKPACD